MARGNPANTQYLDTTGPTSPIITHWTFVLKNNEKNTFGHRPVVAGGTVYFSARHLKPRTSEDKSIQYAVDAWTGEERERFTPPRVVQNQRISGLAVFRDTLYVGTRGGKVYALNATTGDEFWSFPTDGRPTGVTVANGNLYATSKGTFDGDEVDGYVYVLRALTGEERWRFKADGAVAGPPAVKDGTVFISARRRGGVYALDAETGDLRWNDSGHPPSTISCQWYCLRG